MAGKVRYYESASVRISYDVERCIHAAECVRRLPDVFNPDRRPWVDPDRAAADAIEATIVHCPTGALHYERLAGGSEEQPDPDNTVAVSPDGPLYLRGRVRVSAADGGTMLEDYRVALCRCGASAIKPLCDGKHHAIGFQDAGGVREATGSSAAAAGGEVTVSPQPNGPNIVRGAFHLVDGRGTRCSRYEKAAFCPRLHVGRSAVVQLVGKKHDPAADR
jgi:uncharacterized Fe-S cluster protein YjdI/CDGSH-type Zn-finger protein